MLPIDQLSRSGYYACRLTVLAVHNNRVEACMSDDLGDASSLQHGKRAVRRSALVQSIGQCELGHVVRWSIQLISSAGRSPLLCCFIDSVMSLPTARPTSLGMVRLEKHPFGDMRSREEGTNRP